MKHLRQLFHIHDRFSAQPQPPCDGLPHELVAEVIKYLCAPLDSELMMPAFLYEGEREESMDAYDFTRTSNKIARRLLASVEDMRTAQASLCSAALVCRLWSNVVAEHLYLHSVVMSTVSCDKLRHTLKKLKRIDATGPLKKLTLLRVAPQEPNERAAKREEQAQAKLLHSLMKLTWSASLDTLTLINMPHATSSFVLQSVDSQLTIHNGPRKLVVSFGYLSNAMPTFVNLKVLCLRTVRPFFAIEDSLDVTKMPHLQILQMVDAQLAAYDEWFYRFRNHPTLETLEIYFALNIENGREICTLWWVLHAIPSTWTSIRHITLGILDTLPSGRTHYKDVVQCQLPLHLKSLTLLVNTPSMWSSCLFGQEWHGEDVIDNFLKNLRNIAGSKGSFRSLTFVTLPIPTEGLNDLEYLPNPMDGCEFAKRGRQRLQDIQKFCNDISVTCIIKECEDLSVYVNERLRC
ncbi:unnamed protein product [Somion occarium]|uniref:F-box domain-containing protein n=1 Tax=Somion occarium TaxID=3059160 RepID=A0ABP1DJP4_9APHY